KNPPHPNAMKVFVNWFLGKEGQEFYAKVMKQGTRRLDVDTKWMKQVGVDAAKDVMTIADYHRVRNHLEDKVINVRRPAAKFAELILRKKFAYENCGIGFPASNTIQGTTCVWGFWEICQKG